MAEGDEEADASSGAECTHDDEREDQMRGERLGVPEHAAESSQGHHDAGEDGEALGRFGLRKNAGPDHVDGKASDAGQACGVADPVTLARRAEGIDGDDYAHESDGDGQRFSQAGILMQENGRKNGDDSRGHEDEDVEERERHMAQGNHNAEIVDEIEAGADELATWPLRPERRHVAAGESVGD